MLLLVTAFLLGQALPPNHPPIPDDRAAAPSAADLIKSLEASGANDKDKPFEIAASIGRLYLGQGQFAEAAKAYEQAIAKAEPLKLFYDAQRKAAGGAAIPAADSVGCARPSGTTLQSLFERAQEKAKAKQAPAAVACARAALEDVVDVETSLGHARFLGGDAGGALTAYEKVLALTPDAVDARYSRAALLVDTKGDDAKALTQAKQDFEQILKLVPTGPRAAQATRLLERVKAALAAGGLSKLASVKLPPPSAPPPGPPMLSQAQMDAFANAPKSPEQDAKFAELITTGEDHLAHGRYQEALDGFKQVMPFQPDNPRLRAAMAWALIKLGKPMADRVWQVATETPDAVAALGDTLKAKGDADGAKALWQRLGDAVPAYKPKLEGR